MSEGTSEFGAIVVYFSESRRGNNVTIVDESDRYNKKKEMSANVVGRLVDGEMVYAAIFPRVPPGKYIITHGYMEAVVTVFSQHEAEVDFRNR